MIKNTERRGGTSVGPHASGATHADKDGRKTAGMVTWQST